MKLEVQCPACKTEFRFTDRSETKTVSCPHCGDLVSKDLGTVVLDEAVQSTKPKSDLSGHTSARLSGDPSPAPSHTHEMVE